MVGDAVDNVNIPKIPEALAGKVAALKTPRHILFPGTLTKAMPALYTGGEYIVREATITTNFFDGNPGCLGDFS
jgi:hypothetical protein